jgi:chondroitin 4-sulfotransferase 11
MVTNFDPKKKILFIHIPKTGGSTIENLFFGSNLYSNHKINSAYNDPKFDDYYRFAFVRNPYLRLISVFNYYRNRINTKSQISQQFLALDSLDDFVLKFGEFKKFLLCRTQYHFYHGAEIDFLGHFEQFLDDLKFLINKFNICGEIPNKRHVRENEDMNITPEFIKMVNKKFHKDFCKFGYRKIKPYRVSKGVNLEKFKQILVQRDALTYNEKHKKNNVNLKK